MYQRKISDKLIDLFSKFPVLAVLGPRQSGKTTLVKHIFPDKPYINFEDLEVRAHATEDPKDFLSKYPEGAIFDEIQHAPSLLSYIQLYVDELDRNGLFILTGSQNFILNEKIAQTLAGRICIQTLLPLSYQELAPEGDVYEAILKGGYPRLHRFHLTGQEFYPSYISTYVERDVRQLHNIQNLPLFTKFFSLCAGNVAQIKNASHFSADLGVSQHTVNAWLGLLELGYITFSLQPYYKNFNKRLIKSPKIYFYDTGLVCHLLGIETVLQLENHPLKGALFENFVIVETLKNRLNQGLSRNMYFWKDQGAHEVDLLIESGMSLHAIEIKTAKTIHHDFLKHLKYLQELAPDVTVQLVYGGTEHQNRKNIEIIGVRDYLLRD